jgi:hypothetical protein
VLYEGGPKPPGLRLTPDEFIARLEALIAAGEREQALDTFMLNAAGVAPEELEILHTRPAWPGRVAAVHTIPRELRAINDYSTDLARFAAVQTPVLTVVGELSTRWKGREHVALLPSPMSPRRTRPAPSPGDNPRVGLIMNVWPQSSYRKAAQRISCRRAHHMHRSWETAGDVRDSDGRPK